MYSSYFMTQIRPRRICIASLLRKLADILDPIRSLEKHSIFLVNELEDIFEGSTIGRQNFRRHLSDMEDAVRRLNTLKGHLKNPAILEQVKKNAEKIITQAKEMEAKGIEKTKIQELEKLRIELSRDLSSVNYEVRPTLPPTEISPEMKTFRKIPVPEKEKRRFWPMKSILRSAALEL